MQITPIIARIDWKPNVLDITSNARMQVCHRASRIHWKLYLVDRSWLIQMHRAQGTSSFHIQMDRS
jgi:hypothetical protein